MKKDSNTGKESVKKVGQIKSMKIYCVDVKFLDAHDLAKYWELHY